MGSVVVLPLCVLCFFLDLEKYGRLLPKQHFSPKNNIQLYNRVNSKAHSDGEIHACIKLTVKIRCKLHQLLSNEPPLLWTQVAGEELRSASASPAPAQESGFPGVSAPAPPAEESDVHFARSSSAETAAYPGGGAAAVNRTVIAALLELNNAALLRRVKGMKFTGDEVHAQTRS